MQDRARRSDTADVLRVTIAESLDGTTSLKPKPSICYSRFDPLDCCDADHSLEGIELAEIRAWAQLSSLFSPSHLHDPHDNALSEQPRTPPWGNFHCVILSHTRQHRWINKDYFNLVSIHLFLSYKVATFFNLCLHGGYWLLGRDTEWGKGFPKVF